MSGEWDIKNIKISLGGVDDEKGFLDVELFNKDSLGIYKNRDHNGEADLFIEDISIDAAKRVRDFLIYALADQ